MKNPRFGFAAAPLILVVVAVALLIYYMRSGIGFPSLFRERSASSTTSSSSGFFGGVPLGGDEERPVIQPRATSSQTKPLTPRDVPAGFTLEEISPNYKKVRISSVSPGSGTNPSRISLRTDFMGEETMNISQWTFQANRNSWRLGGRGVSVYSPYGSPTPEDIMLRKGDTVNIYSTESPIGVNVQVNKCFGYLERHIDFKPQFRAGCPALDRTPVASFTGACQDYIRSLSSCVEPLSNPPIPRDDSGCRDYLSKINYAGCFDAHHLDADFLKHEWRIWAKINFMDLRHDRILLLDAKGLLVDVYTY